MHIIKVRTAGFCMGVGLALRKLDQALMERSGQTASAGGRLLMLGPIIHNPQVLAYYTEQGVVQADTPDDVRPEDTVLIRAHGIPQESEAILLKKGAMLIDATCPKVKQAQLAIAKATEGGIPLYLFGEEEHPEVRGLVSYACGSCHVFGSLAALQQEKNLHGPAVLAAQTTQERLEFEAIQEWLAARVSLTVLSTICDATKKRQEETRRVALHSDAMLVVGGQTSGNTRRLADVIRSCGVPVWHIETAAEAPLEQLKGMKTIGLTAGASTPRALIDEVERLLMTQAPSEH